MVVSHRRARKFRYGAGHKLSTSVAECRARQRDLWRVRQLILIGTASHRGAETSMGALQARAPIDQIRECSVAATVGQ